MTTNYLFSELNLPDELVRDLERQNPWWRGQPLPVLPEFRRWPYDKLRQRLDSPIAPIVVVRGPRQIGKSTLQMQLIRTLLSEGVASARILRVQFDELPALLHANFEEPILRIVDWFEKNILGVTLNETAHRNEPAFLFFDEVQNLPAWDVQLKSLVDHSTARVMVTGSSALRIEKGRDSLAGRIHTLEVGPLRLTEIAALRDLGELRPLQQDNGWPDWLIPDFWRELVNHAHRQHETLQRAFAAFSERGAYPLAQAHTNISWQDIAGQLNETVVKRVIEHDLRVGERGRKRDRQLLEEVFRMGCRYIGQSPNPATLAEEARRALNANIGPQRIRHYLEFLDSSLLLRTIEPLEIRLKKRRGYSKLCLCDHALRAAWLQEVIPLDAPTLDHAPHLQDLAGRIAESTTGYFFASLTGPSVAHLPERGGDPEVDFILTIGEHRIPVEVKYRRVIDPLSDTVGLRTFIEKAVNNAPFGLLVTRDDARAVVDPRTVSVFHCRHYSSFDEWSRTMARKKSAKPPTKVESIRHKDKRKNIPTEELRDFVAADEHTPKTMLYPRDPSLDPQLVWKGKDEQDRADLAVPVVPIYIQEKIHPQAIIDALPRIDKSGDQPDLFADFNGLPADFDQRVDFYKHDGNWSNRMILGDSLLVMTSLAEKEGLKGKVQTIYIDPPYGIKFGSNWQVSTRKRDVKDGKAEDASRQPEQVRAFRDTWQLGIHSYLAYLRDRLTVARELLTETGSVFVQIGDENVHLVRSVMDEVFGCENNCGLITFKKTSGAGSFAGGTNLLAATSDYVLWFAKNLETIKYRQLYLEKEIGGVGGAAYSTVEEPTGERRPATREEIETGEVVGRFLRPSPMTSETVREAQTTVFEVELDGTVFLPKKGGWKTNVEGMGRLKAAKRLMGQGTSLAYVRYHNDFPAFPLTSLWNDTQSGSGMEKVYVVQTNQKVIERCLLMTTDPGDLVLDPTCGSGTTAYVAEQWGRRWITCDTSRVAMARTRLMAAKYPYYLLADSPEGMKKEGVLASVEPSGRRVSDSAEHVAEEHVAKEHVGLTPRRSPEGTGDIKKGFVYKRVPHVTLKSIANNPDIKEGMTRAQIDAAIAKHAETETLFDQPYEDNKRVRVCGPFSVESLSPHRTISAEEKKRESEVGTKHGFKMRVIGPDNFGHMILENLRKAGVQNTRKGERLKFDSLDVYPGEWIHGAGTYAETDGTPKRAAVCIGPEHGTVGATLIKEAAKEAVKGVGFDVLIVCGFAFDPSVSEEAKRYGKLVVLPTKMNPDLAMGDELLKKTGAGNLFMVFGEPDVEIRYVSEPRASVSGPLPDSRGSEKLVVEIKGLDVYDPSTGAIRSSSTDDIACWFIDTDYNGESFFVRHAYFTGADEPYDKLKRALRADIDEAAWSSLYTTVSRPFNKPESGKNAVKVINHYGYEVLKVFAV